jgi:hypothetical protein
LASVAAAIFIHVQEQMKFAGAPDDSTPPSRLQSATDWPSGTLLLIFAYLAIIANCSATITSFLISDKLTATPFVAAQQDYEKRTKANSKGGLTKTNLFGDGFDKLLVRYTKWNLWRFFKYFCESLVKLHRKCLRCRYQRDN